MLAPSYTINGAHKASGLFCADFSKPVQKIRTDKKHIQKRATSPQSDYKGNVAGSNADYSFNYVGTSDNDTIYYDTLTTGWDAFIWNKKFEMKPIITSGRGTGTTIEIGKTYEVEVGFVSLFNGNTVYTFIKIDDKLVAWELVESYGKTAGNIAIVSTGTGDSFTIS